MYTLTPPTLEPVSLDEAKLAARVDGAQWDDIITPAIAAARQLAEQHTGRRFMSQVLRFELDDWPALDQLLPVYRPGGVAVTYWDGSAYTALATPADFAWAACRTGLCLAPALGTSYPTLGEIAIGPRVRVDVTVGAATAAGVDECVKTFIKAVVATVVHSPDLVQNDAINKSVLLLGMLDPVRVYA